MERKNGEIRKGPWKAEEDEVLVNHVKKYGPRDWSSIRSKGLLHRTGKSCRLRWVNKLRPNLKNGCKFTAEEERVVIELQAQFGNKWARIATYLPGRTDNDVKNFWSSRQKRLARILQNSATASPSSSNSKPLKSTKKEVPIFHHVATLEAPMLSSSMEEASSSKAQSCSSSTYMEDLRPDGHINMVPLPDHVVKPEFPICDANYFHHQFDPRHSQIEAFPQLLPQPQPQPQQELHQLTFSSPETQLLHRPEDPFFLNVFAAVDAPELGGGPQVSLSSLPLFDPMASFMPGARDVQNPAQDISFDDFPDFEFFDHI